MNAIKTIYDSLPISCPNRAASFQSPTSFAFFLTMAFASFIASMVIFARYNDIKTFNRTISSRIIANHFWIVYFTLLSCRYLLQAVAYPTLPNEKTYHILQNVILVLFGFTTLFLSLALNYQLKYRSEQYGFVDFDREAQRREGEKSSLLGRSPLRIRNLKENIVTVETALLLLFLVYVTFTGLSIFFKSTALGVLHVTAFILQRVSILIFGLCILLKKYLILEESPDYPEYINKGPSNSSRIILATSLILLSIMDLPMPLWDGIFQGSGCILYFMSGPDLMAFFSFVSHILLFVFIKKEYDRNKKDCIWQKIATVEHPGAIPE